MGLLPGVIEGLELGQDGLDGGVAAGREVDGFGGIAFQVEEGGFAESGVVEGDLGGGGGGETLVGEDQFPVSTPDGPKVVKLPEEGAVVCDDGFVFGDGGQK